MKSNSVAKSQAIRSFRLSFPWVIALLGCLLLMCSYIYNYTYGVFFKPIADQFGWSRAAMSGSFTIRSLVGAALVVPMGYWADRYGPRRILLPCFILLGISMLSIARVTNLWQLYLVQGVFVGIGTSGPLVCVLSTVAKWHDRRRGFALGIASAGSGLSSVIFAPLASKFIETIDWQYAIFILGVIILVFGIPAALIMRDPPHVVRDRSAGKSIRRRSVLGVWRLLPRFLKNPVFLAVIIMFILVNAVTSMVLNHLVNYATDIGITALTAAGMMSVVGVACTGGRLGMGIVSDRVGTRADAVICFNLLLASILLLLSQNQVLMWIAAALFGVGYGGAVPLIASVMGERVDTEQLATAIGVGTMAGFTGAALGPWMGGAIFDASGDYLWALLISGVASIAALIIILRLPSGRQEIMLN